MDTLIATNSLTLGRLLARHARYRPSHTAVVIGITGPNPLTMNSADINDHLPSSSPSGKTVLIIFGCLGGFFAMLVLAVEFRATLGF